MLGMSCMGVACIIISLLEGDEEDLCWNEEEDSTIQQNI
jgi:hypothetical protein